MKKNTARNVSRLLIAIIAALIILCSYLILTDIGLAEDYEEEYVKVWVLCQPDSWVNVREFAKKSSEEVAMGEAGDWFYSDMVKRRGFLHVFGSFEAGEGWISLGYVVFDEPEAINETCFIESNGRVACRRSIGGDKRCWVYCDDDVIVYWASVEWSVTNKGFIKTEFIRGIW